MLEFILTNIITPVISNVMAGLILMLVSNWFFDSDDR